MVKSYKKTRMPRNSLIGRENEKETLRDLVDSDKAEFIAIYGRRRVGKTYLVKTFVSRMSNVFFHVTGIQKGTTNDQLKEFALQLGHAFYKGAPVIARKNWKDAFNDLHQALEKLPENAKIILFFDELPWMATPRSKLLMSLELYWNRYWSFDPRIKLIICGSATSWIIDNIINNRGGLHNRVTRTIKLQPFTLLETKKFLKKAQLSFNNRQILELYTVLGGVPLYWTYLAKGLSSSQCIEKLCFQGDSPLCTEFDRLFASLFEDPEPYKDLIRVIAKHHSGIGQSALIKEAKLPSGGSTIKKLRQLEDAGFILSLVPYGHKEKGLYYLIDDEYSLFYLTWIEPNMRTIRKKTIGKGFWLSKSSQPAWKIWSGYAFETVCYKHIDQIRQALSIDPGADVGTYRYAPRTKADEGIQIDLLFDRFDNTVTICEIKCHNTEFAIDKSYAKSLMKKVEIFRSQTRTKKNILLSMITAFGLKPTMYSEEIIASDATLDDLFKAIS